MLVVRVQRKSASQQSEDFNDGVSIGDATSNWAQNSIYKRVWSDHFPSLSTVTFAVELPASMINSIIFQGTSPQTFLDFSLQDDTAVDYVQLLLGR